MILNQNNRNIERGGIRVEREATIVADAVAFKVLSDMLYPDKPLAIIRELMCNAYDSHTAAGKPDEPVHIHLPNVMEPYLSIRDFGLGLSFRDACVLMLTYFKSTKREDNKVTGALGLGSKTPFSYVDSYTVTTRFNGRKFTFNAFINENGNPAMALLARERTTEGNGLEIMVPVRRSDFHVFEDRARTVLEWFRVPPVVSGNKDFKINRTEYELFGSTWKIGKQQGYWGYNGTAYAIQGNIAYPINPASMPTLPAGYAELLRMPIYMEFPIGQISFTAGRDAISYDKATVANLIAGLDVVVKELPEQSQVKFDACKTKWEAHALYGELINDSMSGSIIRVLNQHKKLSFKWGGEEIKTSTVTITMKSYKDPVITALWGGGSRSKRYANTDPINITANAKTVFYIDDMSKGAVTRMRSWRYANNPSYDLYLLGTDTKEVDVKRVAIDAMLEELGNPPFILASTLPPKKRNPANLLSKKTNKVLTVDSKSYYNNNFSESTDDIDIEEGGYYVPVSRQKVIDDKGVAYTNFSAMIRQAAIMKLIPEGTEIVAVNPSQLKKFTDNEDWVNAVDHIKEAFIADMKTNNVLDAIAAATDYQTLRYTNANYYYNALNGVSVLVQKMANDHPLRVFVDQCTMQVKSSKVTDVSTMMTMSNWLNLQLDVNGGTAKYKFTAEWDKIQAQYPMLRLINYPDANNIKTALKYVQDMDRLAELEKPAVTVVTIQKAPATQP
jgi:hypothetical protein